MLRSLVPRESSAAERPHVRILLIPPRQPEATGNQVTAERHRSTLGPLGHEVLVVDTDGNPEHLWKSAGPFRPDLVHLLHAYRSGSPWLESEALRRLPMVVTLTGTDLHEDLGSPGRHAVVETVLAEAAAVLIQNPSCVVDLGRTHPALASRIHYLPPGILLGTRPWPLRGEAGLSADDLLFLHPAGIRPVKQNLELLELFSPLAAERPRLRLAFCGPVLDPAYGGLFAKALEGRPWARHLGVIPPAAMASALRQSDVVLNHSRSEGLPNALVEAAALGVPILARNIAGNASVVREGENGLLYDDDATFLAQAARLADDPGLRQALRCPAPDRFSAEAEARALETIYREALAGAP